MREVLSFLIAVAAVVALGVLVGLALAVVV